MIDTAQLIQSLVAVGDDMTATYFKDGRHLDWSTNTPDGVNLEVGNEDGEAVQLSLSRDEVSRIQRALTLWLLNHAD